MSMEAAKTRSSMMLPMKWARMDARLLWSQVQNVPRKANTVENCDGEQQQDAAKRELCGLQIIWADQFKT